MNTMSEQIIINDLITYEVTDIKEGGMGNVLVLKKVSEKISGINLSYRNMMAPKTFKDNQFVSTNKLFFERELGFWLNISGEKNIAKLTQVLFIKGKLFALMPFYESNLRDFVMKNRIFEIDIAKYIILSIINGLNNAYKKYRIIHEDIKPENILCEYGYDKKIYFNVSDWGVSNIQKTYCPQVPTKDWLPPSFVDVMARAGTLPYMAPERLLGSPPSISDDIFSLGMIFYEMLTGHLPYNSSASETISSNLLDLEYFNIASKRLHNNFHRNIIDTVMRCIHPDIHARCNDYHRLMKNVDSLKLK